MVNGYVKLNSMAEDLQVITGTKAEQYEALIPQIKGLLEGEPDMIANLANVCAALHQQFNWLWVGFYLVKIDILVLGPFRRVSALLWAHPGLHWPFIWLWLFEGGLGCFRCMSEVI